MAEMTKQANFRLSIDHVRIISKLSTLGRMTKASVVERALELLEARVNAGEHIPETPPAEKTRQANFRLRVRHVEIINTLAARENVTKATVVERALELLDEQMSAGSNEVSSSSPRAMGSLGGGLPAGAVVGNTARDLSVVEPLPVQHQAEVKPLREVRPAAELEVEPLASTGESAAAPLRGAATVASAGVSSGAAMNETGSLDMLARKAELEVARAQEDARRLAEQRALQEQEALAARAAEERKARERMRAEAAREAEEKAQRAIEDMRSSLRKEAYKQAEAEAEKKIEAAKAKVEAQAQAEIQDLLVKEKARLRAELQAEAETRIREAQAKAEAQAQAALEVRKAKAEAEASAQEAKLTAQIEALQQKLSASESQVSSLKGQLDEGRESRLNDRMEALLNQMAESERRRDMVTPAHMAMPAAPTVTATSSVGDPRIDSILRQLEDQRQSSKDAQTDARMEALLGRIEQSLRSASGQPEAKGSASDDIIKVLQAVGIGGQGQLASSDAVARQIADARAEGLAAGRAESSASIAAARAEGREEGIRQARSEAEIAIEAARAAGYEAGQRDAQTDVMRAIEEARTEGAFRERAKIANMRGWVFGEKRRYLKVHVTM